MKTTQSEARGLFFRCRQCGQALSTPQEAAGHKFRCPSCLRMDFVPAASDPRPDSDGARLRFGTIRIMERGKRSKNGTPSDQAGPENPANVPPRNTSPILTAANGRRPTRRVNGGHKHVVVAPRDGLRNFLPSASNGSTGSTGAPTKQSTGKGPHPETIDAASLIQSLTDFGFHVEPAGPRESPFTEVRSRAQQAKADSAERFQRV